MTKFEERGFDQLTTPATDEQGEVVTLTKEFAQKAKRGFPWPEDHVKKVSVSMRLDDDLIRFLRSTGKGWQTRANQYLRGMMTK